MGEVIDVPLSHSAIYDRLKFYLKLLNIDEGETPHSFRAGCAISLHSANEISLDKEEAIRQHVGWKTSTSAQWYTRSPQQSQAMAAAYFMANTTVDANPPTFVDDTNLPCFSSSISHS
jgi:integrase